MIKTRLFYLAVLLVSVFLAVFRNGGAATVMLYTLLALPMLSFVVCAIFAYRLKLIQHIDNELVIKAERSLFTVTVENPVALPCMGVHLRFLQSPFVDVDGGRDILIDIPARSSKSFEYSLCFAYRGIYEIGLSSVSVTDFLGLFRLTRRLKTRFSVAVHPRIVYIDDFPLGAKLMSSAHSPFEQRRDEDYSSISDVRKYEPSDSVKKIHWKLSARIGELMVKNFQTTVLNATVVMLDTKIEYLNTTSDIELQDHIVEAAVAVCYDCLKRQWPVSFIYNEDRPIYASGVADFEDIYAVAARLEFNNLFNLSNLMSAYFKEQTYDQNVVVITSNLDERLCEVMLEAHYFGHSIILIYINPENTTEPSELLSTLMSAGITLYPYLAGGIYD